MTADTLPDDKSRRKMAGSALAAFAAVGVAAWIAVAVGAIIRKPGWEGWLTGIFGGFFVGLLIMAGGAWTAISLARAPKPPDDFTPPSDPELAAVLAELETARQDTLRQIKALASWRVPLGAAGGIALWVAGLFTDDPNGTFDLIGFIVFGGIAGYVWASLQLSNQYEKLYKTRVLPKLAASFGDLSWRPAVMPDLAQLRTENIFREEGLGIADDEITGTWRGLPLSIVELKLEQRRGKNKTILFDGLVVILDLKRDTGGVTAVVADGGSFGNLRDRMTANGRKRVALEDPVFEKIYEVYGTDQVAARALLHPAFMEKLLALGELPEFSRPLALASGKRLTFVMPKRIPRNLFEAPSVSKPAASRDALTALRKDIEAVLAAADAVIDLDHRFAGPAPLT